MISPGRTSAESGGTSVIAAQTRLAPGRRQPETPLINCIRRDIGGYRACTGEKTKEINAMWEFRPESALDRENSAPEGRPDPAGAGPGCRGMSGPMGVRRASQAVVEPEYRTPSRRRVPAGASEVSADVPSRPPAGRINLGRSWPRRRGSLSRIANRTLAGGQDHATPLPGGRSGRGDAESAPASMIARSYQRGRYASYDAHAFARRGWRMTHWRNASQAGEVKK